MCLEMRLTPTKITLNTRTGSRDETDGNLVRAEKCTQMYANPHKLLKILHALGQEMILTQLIPRGKNVRKSA
jgi:hypothetical protein